MAVNLPNTLSLLRLPLAVLFLLTHSPLLQGIIIVVAGATDFVDGWLARRFQQRSRTGEVLDPITDKLFVLTVLLTLYVREQIQTWELLLLLLRDVYNTAAYCLARLRGWNMQFKARMSGKVVTTLQIGTILAFVVLPQLAHVMLAITVAASLYSVYDYTRAGLADLRQTPRSGQDPLKPTL